MISKILLPTDFSEVANNALDFALDLIKKTNSELHIMTINPVPVVDINFPQETFPLFMDELKQAAEAKLEMLKQNKRLIVLIKDSRKHWNAF